MTSRFNATPIGGTTHCTWDGKEVATIRLSLFPGFHELDGYDVTLREELHKGILGRVRGFSSCFDEEQDAIDAVRHACIVAFVRPDANVSERPICRIRDEHIQL